MNRGERGSEFVDVNSQLYLVSFLLSFIGYRQGSKRENLRVVILPQNAFLLDDVDINVDVCVNCC